MAFAMDAPSLVPGLVSQGYQAQNTALQVLSAGLALVKLNNMDNASPVTMVLAGSLVEINGLLFQAAADEGVTAKGGGPPPVYHNAANFIYASPAMAGSASSCGFYRSNSVPAYNSRKGGFYSQNGAGPDRCIGAFLVWNGQYLKKQAYNSRFLHNRLFPPVQYPVAVGYRYKDGREYSPDHHIKPPVKPGTEGYDEGVFDYYAATVRVKPGVYCVVCAAGSGGGGGAGGLGEGNIQYQWWERGEDQPGESGEDGAPGGLVAEIIYVPEPVKFTCVIYGRAGGAGAGGQSAPPGGGLNGTNSGGRGGIGGKGAIVAVVSGEYALAAFGGRGGTGGRGGRGGTSWCYTIYPFRIESSPGWPDPGAPGEEHGVTKLRAITDIVSIYQVSPDRYRYGFSEDYPNGGNLLNAAIPNKEDGGLDPVQGGIGGKASGAAGMHGYDGYIKFFKLD